MKLFEIVCGVLKVVFLGIENAIPHGFCTAEYSVETWIKPLSFCRAAEEGLRVFAKSTLP
jgi:hypothetical protein